MNIPQAQPACTDVLQAGGEYAPYPSYSFVYITKHYRCGCSTTMPMLRDRYEMDYPMHHRMDDRNITSLDNCPACNESALRALERKLERRVGA